MRWPIKATVLKLVKIALLAIITLPWPLYAETLAEIRIGGVDSLGDLPTLVADQHALFSAENLSASVDYSLSGEQNLDLLRNRQTDFALMSLTPVVLDMLTDTTPGGADDPVILASLVHSTRFNQVVALADRRLREPHHLAGKRVGLMRGTNAEFTWWLFAAYHKLDTASIAIIDYRIDAITDALINGDIDAAVIWEPWSAYIEQQAGQDIHRFPGSNIYAAKWILVTRREMIEQNPAVITAVLRAYQNAINIIDAEPAQALRLYFDHSQLAGASLPVSAETLAYDLSLDWSLIATFRQQLDWAKRAGYVQVAEAPPILSMIAPQFLRALSPSAIGLPHINESALP
ncbi:MAG: ABC transporter substrate-binding protein [Gammaproteobacteria bacterium]